VPEATHLDILADVILAVNVGTTEGMEIDSTDIYEALQPYLEPDVFKALGAKLELCPIHYCDFQICVDDQVHGDEVYA